MSELNSIHYDRDKGRLLCRSVKMAYWKKSVKADLEINYDNILIRDMAGFRKYTPSK